jgi:CRP/FNR family transcriptional regulator
MAIQRAAERRHHAQARAPMRRRTLRVVDSNRRRARRAGRSRSACPPASRARRAGTSTTSCRTAFACAREKCWCAAATGFCSLYSIRTGSCKSVVTTPGGQQQIAGYHIAGDMLGAEAIFATTYDATVTALEDSEFCVIPFERMETLARQNGDFQHRLALLLSREIARERRVMLMLGTMRAEQRLAAFLLDLAERYRARGYSSCEFVLRMTREEIGSHLGLKLETVSRLFSRFHQEGLIIVQGREVKLLDREALRQLVDATRAVRRDLVTVPREA